MDVESNAPGSLRVVLRSEAETDHLGRALADLVAPGVVIGLVGDLGAGKTRLSRAIAEALGVDPLAITSPTFVLIQEYEGRSMPIRHFDTYRLGDPEAFDALGAAEYWIEADGVCLIEWADLVADRLPPSTWWVRIEATGPGSRVARVDLPEPEAAALLAALRAPDPS